MACISAMLCGTVSANAQCCRSYTSFRWRDDRRYRRHCCLLHHDDGLENAAAPLTGGRTLWECSRLFCTGNAMSARFYANLLREQSLLSQWYRRNKGNGLLWFLQCGIRVRVGRMHYSSSDEL